MARAFLSVALALVVSLVYHSYLIPHTLQPLLSSPSPAPAGIYSEVRADESELCFDHRALFLSLPKVWLIGGGAFAATACFWSLTFNVNVEVARVMSFVCVLLVAGLFVVRTITWPSFDGTRVW